MATAGNRHSVRHRPRRERFVHQLCGIVDTASARPRRRAGLRHSRRRVAVPTLFPVLLIVLSLFATACRAETVTSEADRGGTDQSATAGADDDDTESTLPDTDAGDTGRTDPDTDDDDTESTLPDLDPPRDPVPPTGALPRVLTVEDIDCVPPTADDRAGLTAQGRALFERHVATQTSLPSYALAVAVNPADGDVSGAMRAIVPAQARTINFRVFAGMPAFESGLVIENVMVDGELVDVSLDGALLSLPASSGTGDETLVELDFRFAIDQMAANDDLLGAITGATLQPDQVGLLGRTETGMQLGHWFPVWLPEGVRTDADPSGFGDIGAFPAANICATITVPSGYQVVTGGVRIDTTDTSIVEAGAGLRDFSMVISDDLVLAARIVQNVEIRVWGPTDDPDALMTVLEYAVQSFEVLSTAFGPYPWTEIEVVSAPLGAGVGGMEWPGAVWVEQSLFAGGLPGVGDLGGLFDQEGFGSVLGAVGGDAFTTSLEWTVAHELAHEWWHATVGNDSIASPAVDEPLAQFSACLAMERIHPENWRAICEAQTIDQYAQARALGITDAVAEQPSDAFDSSLQYGAIIYGKAPGFYLAAGDLLGWDALTASLRSFVTENSFALVSTNTLRSHLIEQAGDDGVAVAELWDRWFRQARGDDDIEPSDALAAFGGLDLGNFDVEGLDLAELFGDDFDIDALLGENSELFDQLLEDLVENSGTGGD